ncbi:hypothetical protein [Streptomyces xanthophaeus]
MDDLCLGDVVPEEGDRIRVVDLIVRAGLAVAAVGVRPPRIADPIAGHTHRIPRQDRSSAPGGACIGRRRRTLDERRLPGARQLTSLAPQA